MVVFTLVVQMDGAVWLLVRGEVNQELKFLPCGIFFFFKLVLFCLSIGFFFF